MNAQIITNPYECCPEYETAKFKLRLVSPADADDLLECYSDRAAVTRMNADSCTSDFYYQSREEMDSCIKFWLDAYTAGHFVRFSVVDKSNSKAVGTVEIFGGNAGVLRIDLASTYETGENIKELTELAIDRFIRDFAVGKLMVKSGHTPERRKVFEQLGFTASKTFRPGMGYFEYAAD
ncbi:MAG: hypothetical protein VB042_09400 [Victivallaceae bacterium]|nr:hypothetical protein [Victivallaceae bacterium]